MCVFGKCQKYENLSIEDVLDKLSLLYSNAIDSLRDAIAIYVKEGRIPDITERENGLFAYPELCVTWEGKVDHCEKPVLMHVLLNGVITVTQPELFRAYLVEQLSILQQDYDVTFPFALQKLKFLILLSLMVQI